MLAIKKTLNHPKADPVVRERFEKKIEEYKSLGQPIVYIDESGFAHDSPRTHGYSVKGQRCYGTRDWGAKGRTNAIGALIGKTLLTVGLFDSNVNTEVFTAWIINDLLPKLPPKTVLVMDNASFHKGKEMKTSIENANFTIEYLPPYSPDLNPIEKKWAQAKQIRKTQGCEIDELFKLNEI